MAKILETSWQESKNIGYWISKSIILSYQKDSLENETGNPTDLQEKP